MEEVFTIPLLLALTNTDNYAFIYYILTTWFYLVACFVASVLSAIYFILNVIFICCEIILPYFSFSSWKYLTVDSMG